MNAAINVIAEYLPADDDFALTGVFQSWEAVLWGDKKRTQWANSESKVEFWDRLRLWAQNIELIVYGWDIWPAFCVMDGILEIDEGRLKLDITGQSPKGCLIAGNPPTIIKVSIPGGGEIKFVDLENFGIRSTDYGVNSSAGKLSAARQAALDYWRLCWDYDMGPPAATAASQAWQVYKRFHQPDPSAMPPTSLETSRLEEAAYFGGRCECRRLGRFTERLWHLDVSSMYTALGRTAAFPQEYVGCWEWHNGSETPPPGEPDWLIIADATIETSKAYYPASDNVLFQQKVNELPKPMPRQKDDRVIYPVGTFRTALCGPELAIAVGCGHIKQWHKVHYYRPSHLMQHWSAWALSMRQHVKHGERSFLANCVKKIINSLPGKWGQHAKIWKDMKGDNWPASRYEPRSEWCREWGRHPISGVMTQFRTIAGNTQYLDSDELAKEACPAVAAFWTSYGRVFLLGLIGLADQSGEQVLCDYVDSNVYYYDTDSLIVNEAGYNNLMQSGMVNGEPGRLRLIEYGDDCRILGIRRYFIAGKWHVAGPMPDSLVQESLNSQMWKKRVGKPLASAERIDTFESYRHGVVTDDGRVLPFQVTELPKEAKL